MPAFDPVSLLDDDPAILRYPSALLESLRDGWATAIDTLDGASIELVPAHSSELAGHLSRIDDLGQGLVDARLFDGTHPLFSGRPQSAAGRLRFLGDVVLGLLARGQARRVGSELTALRETIDLLAEACALPPPSTGRLKGPRAVEYLAVSWPFQVRSTSYYDGCVPPYDNLPSAPPPLPPPPLPTWITPPPLRALAAPPPLPEAERGAWTLPHPTELGLASSSEDSVGDDIFAESSEVEPVAAPSAVCDESETDTGDFPNVDVASVEGAPEPCDPPGVQVSPAFESLVVASRAADSVDEDPLPDHASRVTVPLFERELVRLGGELALLVYEAGRLFGVGDRTTRLLMREARRLEHPALIDALLGDGARGVRVDRSLMRMIAETQATLDEWRAHAEGEGDLLEMEIRALRKALEGHALSMCRATLAASGAVGLSDEDWADYWAGLAEDADDERLAHDRLAE